MDGHPHLHFVKGDVMDYDATRRAIDGCHIVIHCAAIAGVYSVDRNAVRTMEVNMLGTHQVVKAALDVGVERFVEFSTSEVYGPFIHKGKEDDLTTIGPIGESRWVYAASKLASEHLSYAHYKEDGLPLAIVRPFNVYGPRQVGDGAIRGMVLQALQHAPITLYNDGTQIRAWCFVEDFVDGVLRCAEKPEAIGQAFNLGNPQGTITNFELANMIIRLTNSKSTIVFKPHPGPGSRPARAVDREGDDAARLQADGLARGGHLADDSLVRRAHGGAAEGADAASSSPARPDSSAATCCCARRATGRSSRSPTGRPGSRRSSPSIGCRTSASCAAI